MSSVCLLLATKNGAEYIESFLLSVINQDFLVTEVLVSDDSSVDCTLEIVQRVLAGKIKYRILAGPNLGTTQNFYHMLVESREYDHYAFADQDDVWATFHLSRAIKLLDLNSGVASLIFSPTTHRRDIGKCDIRFVQREFSELIVNNPARGCTIVFNQAAKEFFLQQNWKDILFHDWWTTILVSLKGRVFSFRKPSVWYREHKGQQIGRQNGISNTFEKVRRFSSSLETSFAMCEKIDSDQQGISDINKNKILAWEKFLQKEQLSFFQRLSLLSRLKPTATTMLRTVFTYIFLVL